jgi:hypothetical protein
VLIWHDNNWAEIKMENSGIELSLYDLNKQIIAQLSEFNDYISASKSIDQLYEIHENQFFMLYGQEISYFTLFEIIDDTKFAEEVFSCLKDIGVIKAIDLTENKEAVEIWIMYNNEPTCLYLFPYDRGIIEVGG